MGGVVGVELVDVGGAEEVEEERAALLVRVVQLLGHEHEVEVVEGNGLLRGEVVQSKGHTPVRGVDEHVGGGLEGEAAGLEEAVEVVVRPGGVEGGGSVAGGEAGVGCDGDAGEVAVLVIQVAPVESHGHLGLEVGCGLEAVLGAAGDEGAHVGEQAGVLGGVGRLDDAGGRGGGGERGRARGDGRKKGSVNLPVRAIG